MAEQQKQPSLFQQLQQNLAKMAQPTQAPGEVIGQTEALRAISQAASGKQAPSLGGAGPSRSVQAEMQVVDQVKRGQEELAKQNQIQQLAFAQEAKNIQDEEQFKNKLLSEDELNARDKYLTTQERILSEYTTGQRQLDLNKDKAKLEQLGFNMRLSNDKYLSELQRQATMANLSDALAFEEEMYRTIFADEEELLRNDLDFRALMAADKRTFEEEVMRIDIDTAIAMANAENRAISQRQMWEGISGLGQAGVSAYASGMFKKEPTAIYQGPGSSQNIAETQQQFGINPMGVGQGEA